MHRFENKIVSFSFSDLLAWCKASMESKAIFKSSCVQDELCIVDLLSVFNVIVFLGFTSVTVSIHDTGPLDCLFVVSMGDLLIGRII